jgi:hypothetical protein
LLKRKKRILVLSRKRGEALHGCHFGCFKPETLFLMMREIKKETIKYSIFSFLFSTLRLQKEKLKVDKAKQEHIFTNYATLGFGNYRTLNAELFVNQELNNNDYVGAMFRHLSSQGGISGVDDRFYDSSIDLTYGANYNDMSWNLNLGYKTKSITGMDYRKILAQP